MSKNQMKLTLFQRNKPHQYTTIIIIIKFVVLFCATIHIQFSCQFIPHQALAVTIQLSINPVYVSIAFWFLEKFVYNKTR